MKKFYRYFGGLLSLQEKWLNKMAQEGYRLIKTGKISYQFEECQPGEYQYAVEFVGHKSFKSEKEYKEFLEELGYRVLFKNINLNYSLGKIRWRPYGSGMGQVSTSFGSYNRELLIVEKKNDGKPFQLHTTNSDKANYYKPIRNAWLTAALMFLAFAALTYTNKDFISSKVIAFGILGLLCSVPTIVYQLKISSYSAKSKIEE